MKHVFVETNFLISLLRPFPERDAKSLYERHGKDLELRIPWCAFTEARRTLEQIVREDLSFIDGCGKFLGALMGADSRPDAAFQQHVEDFIKRSREFRKQRFFDYPNRIEGIKASVAVIEPSRAVVDRTLGLFKTKALPPFDEMILGAVLADAEALQAEARKEKKQADIWLCNLNKKDFMPKNSQATLVKEYQRLGIQYLADFSVP